MRRNTPGFALRLGRERQTSVPMERRWPIQPIHLRHRSNIMGKAALHHWVCGHGSSFRRLVRR